VQPYRTLERLVSLSHYFLRLVKFKVQSFRTLRGAGSLLPNIFVVCGVQGATLSHSEGVRVTFTSFFVVCEFQGAALSNFEGVIVTFT